MKKQILIALSVLMALALAVPAYAAIEFGGDYTLEFEYSKTGTDPGEFDHTGELGLDFSAKSDNVSLSGDLTASNVPASSSAVSPDLKVNTVYIDAKGALVEGGSELTVRAGRFSHNVGEWVSRFGTLNAVRVSGINLGPTDVTLYRGYSGANTVTAIRAEGGLDVIDLDATYVIIDDAAAANVSRNFAVEAGLEPADGVELGLIFGSDGANAASGYRATVDLSTIDNFDLGFMYYNAAVGFNPSFGRVRNNDRRVAGDTVGYRVNVETEQGGLPIEFAYINENNQAGTDGETTIEVSTEISNIGLGFSNTTEQGGDVSTEIEVSGEVAEFDVTFVTASVNGVLDENTITIERGINVPLLGDTDFEWETVLPNGGPASSTLAAEWSAPIGVDFEFEYGVNDQEISLTGEYEVSF